MAKPIRKGVNHWYTGGTNIDFTLRLPDNLVNGELLFLHIVHISTTATLTDAASKGWVLLAAQVMGSRKIETYVRKYNSADPSTVYTLNKTSASISSSYVTEAVASHGVSDLNADFILGAKWARPSASSIVQMPSITTPASDYMALAISGEATTSVGGDPVLTTPAGFAVWGGRPEVSGASIEQIWSYYKEMPTAGPTGTPIADYGANQATTANAAGYQIGIPPLAEGGSISVGQIKAYGSVRPSATEIVIANKKIAATGTVEAVLYDAAGANELARVTVTHDATTKWGNARFVGLFANTSYLVKFFVNGTEQTDAVRHPKTLPAPGTAQSFRFVTGSCQFTASNHPVFDRIREENPAFVGHMGDIHYVDATEEVAWRGGMESSLAAAKFAQMLDTIPMSWSMDNHDRIISDKGGAGTALNLGVTNPKTAEQWKHLAGSHDWASPDGLGQAWQVGRVLFISADLWSARDDPDFDAEPRTFLGATQKAWLKNLMSSTTAVLIVWLSQWTNRNNGNGRWNSFPTETAELEAWLDARPEVKRKLIMIGGDSHSPQAGDGDYGGVSGYRFLGVPSLNFSGFNRGSTTGDGSTGWNIVNEGAFTTGNEADWGEYSRVDIVDDGTMLKFRWTGRKVDVAGNVTSRAYFERTFGQPWDKLMHGGVLADRAFIGDQPVWRKDVKGLDPQFDFQA